MKFVIAMYLIGFIFIGCMFWGAIGIVEADKAAIEHINKTQNELHKNIGKTVIIRNDTLVVLRFNFWGNYVLSNGMEIHPSYFEQTNNLH